MVTMVRGEGNYLWDTKGDKWLDFRSGIMSASLGHGSKVIGEALRSVTESGIVNSYTNYSENEQKLRLLMGDFAPGYVWRLLSTGAETLDRAMQVAYMHFRRPIQVAVIKGGFHGKMMQMSFMREPNGPWGNPFKILSLPLNATKVWPHFDLLFYEPVMNLVGVVPDEKLLRKLCDDRGALMVADEMITGFYRCGPRFVSKMADIIVSGKGIGQGAPLAVIGVQNKLAEIDIPVAWSTTAAGNNISATIGLYVLRHMMRNEEVIKNSVRNIEERLLDAGLWAMGALGFKQVDKSRIADVNHRMTQHRVIATLRDDGLMRVGPSFITNARDFEIFNRVLEK